MDFYTGNIVKYAHIIIGSASKKAKASKKKEDKEFGKILKNILLDLEGSRTCEKVKLTRDDNFITNTLFHPFTEINSSFESLKNIPTYISIFPFQKKGISKYAYLRYHVENYLHELYILRERMVKYSKIINRAYKKSSISKQINEEMGKLEKITLQAFDKYTLVRGSHVHQYRYSEKDIDRLSLFDTLSNSPDKEFVKTIGLLYKMAFKDIRKKWINRMKTDIKEILKLLDHYCEILSKTIIKDNEPIRPWN